MRLPSLRLPRLATDWIPSLPGRGVLLYAAYTVVLFFLFLVAQFPHDVLVRRALASVDLRPFQLDYESTRFAWLRGYEFRNVNLVLAGDDRGVPPLFESSHIFIHPGWSGLLRGKMNSVFVDAALYGGGIDGSWATDNGLQRVTLRLDDLQIGRYRWLSTLFEEGTLGGLLSGAISAEMRRGNLREGQIAGELDIANGQMSGVKMKGMGLPELNFDTIAAKFSANGGQVEIEEFRADGREIKVTGSGQITIRQPLGDSVLNLKASLLPGPEVNDTIKGLLAIIPRPKNAKPDAPLTIVGTLAQPRVR
jgi:type II secretion system protein N